MKFLFLHIDKMIKNIFFDKIKTLNIFHNRYAYTSMFCKYLIIYTINVNEMFFIINKN